MSVEMFVGFDSREAVGTHVFMQSLRDVAKRPVSVQFIGGDPRGGTNAFSTERFSVMERMVWSGWALFVDGADMLLRSCPGELWDLRDQRFAIQVVKHDYRTKHRRKYLGTPMEADNGDYPRKNWSSVMLINCGHRSHFRTRDAVRDALARHDGQYLHRFGWLKDEEIGELPMEWNWLDEYGENPAAKIVHWTTGIPGFSEYRNAPHTAEWRATLQRMVQGMQTHQLSEVS